VFHPERLIAVLGRFKVTYVLAGPIAARLHGSPLMWAVTDILPAVTPDNFEALSNALRHLGARGYAPGITEGRELDLSADALAGSDSWDFVTSCGRVRVWFRPAGTGGYSDLVRGAERYVLHGDDIHVASLRDLVRLHEAPQSEEAAAQSAILRALLARAGS
jgi:hypothetical protein